LSGSLREALRRNVHISWLYIHQGRNSCMAGIGNGISVAEWEL